VFDLSSLDLAKVAAPAVVIAVSPMPIAIVLVLLVHNDHPRASSIAYLVGRATALSVLAVAFLSLPWLGVWLYRLLPTWTHWLMIGAAVVLILAGIRLWRRRRDASGSRWHAQVGGIRPPSSAALGLIPPLIAPRIIAASMAASGQLGALSSAIDTAVALACYLLVASAPVTAPIAIYLALGPRIDPKLERLRQWIHRHHDVATAATLTALGVVILLYALP